MIRKGIMLIIVCVLLGIYIDVSKNDNRVINEVKMVENFDTMDYWGYLIIPKINMYLGFFEYNNELNDVDKNIEIIDTGINNTYLFAGHSGVGKNAYFNDLVKLNEGDTIYLKIDDNEFKYIIEVIRKEEKDGSIVIPKKENILILTTCDQIVKGKQIVIEAKIIN